MGEITVINIHRLIISLIINMKLYQNLDIVENVSVISEITLINYHLLENKPHYYNIIL